jgi:lysyl-tRNA synthetase class 2
VATEYTNLEQKRLEKLGRLQGQGIEPYPARVERTHTNREAIQAFEAAEAAAGGGPGAPVAATLVGRLRSMRPMGKVVFAHIEDGSGRVQLFLRADDLASPPGPSGGAPGQGGEALLDLFTREYDLGDFIQASGEMMRTRTGEATLRVKSFCLLAKSITPLPAAKDEVVDGQIVRHATLSDPETRRATASATPTWRSTPRCARSFAPGRPSCAPCASSWM